MRFDWDPNKAKSNTCKHGITFELAITAFDDPFALLAPDVAHSDYEPREWLIGESDNGILVVVFTRRNGNIIRLISARRASKQERFRYEKFKKLSLP